MKTGNNKNLKLFFAILLSVCVMEIIGQNKEEINAKTIFAEARELANQGTTESMQIAIPKLEQARKLFEKLNDKESEAFCLLILGRCSNSIGEENKALDFYNQAIMLYKQVDDKEGEAITLNNIGVVYWDLRNKYQALKFYEESLRVSRIINNKSGEAATLFNISRVYSDLGEKQKALDFYNQSLPLLRQIRDKAGEATVLYKIGDVYNHLGQPQKALDFYSQASALFKEVGDKEGEVLTLSNTGKIYSNLGDKQQALKFYNQSLSLSRILKNKNIEAKTLTRIGSIYSDSDDIQQGLNFHNESLSLARKINDKSQEATTLSNIGTSYSYLGNKQQALEFYSQSLSLFRVLSDKTQEAVLLNNIGLIYSDLGDERTALKYYNESLSISRVTEDKSGQSTTLNNLGLAYYKSGDMQQSLKFYNQSLSLSRITGNKSREATTLHNIGLIYNYLGDNQQALKFYSEALPVFNQVGDKIGEALTFSSLMVFWQYKNPRLAIFYGKQSIDIYQTMRQNVRGLDKEIQRTFFKTVRGTYHRLSEILIINGYIAEALQILNLLRDQQFFDSIYSLIKPVKKTVKTKFETAFDAELEKERDQIGNVGKRLDDLKQNVFDRQITDDEIQEFKQLETQIKIVSNEFSAVLKKIESEFPKFTGEKDKISKVSDLQEMQTTLVNLKSQTGQEAVAVYQLIGEKNFHLLMITADDIKSVSTPIKHEDLNQKALEFWTLLQSPIYDPRLVGKYLYDVIFKPLESVLPKDTKTIMWSIDGTLRYVPMAALFDGKQFLVERYNHVVFTRADSERLTRNVSNSWSGIGFGSSEATTVEVLGSTISFDDLPGVTEELSVIFKVSDKGILKGETFADRQFSKLNFITAMKQQRPLVHIASHFSFRPGDEARSFLLMGDQTVFTLEEMKHEENLFKGVELLTLSACNTAATQSDANGREVDGFAELAQRLGAGAVMATLWQVSDASTPWLMRDFYMTREGKSGMTKAKALQIAQLGLLNGTAKTERLPRDKKDSPDAKLKVLVLSKGANSVAEKQSRSDVIYLDESQAPLFKNDEKKPFAHPYYWSPFVLYGNWK